MKTDDKTMKKIVIIGNSGAARECYWLLRDVMLQQPNLVFEGFLSFEGHKGDLRDLAAWELGSDDAYSPQEDHALVIGIGKPALRLKAYEKWKARKARFFSLIHPTVKIVGDVALGDANIIAHNCHVSCNTSIGNANYFNGSVVVGHDTRVGHGNFFAPFSIVLGNVRIGSGNSFGVYSAVLDHAHIGNGNTVAPGAHVYKGCSDACIMAGNPALRMNTP